MKMRSSCCLCCSPPSTHPAGGAAGRLVAAVPVGCQRVLQAGGLAALLALGTQQHHQNHNQQHQQEAAQNGLAAITNLVRYGGPSAQEALRAEGAGSILDALLAATGQAQPGSATGGAGCAAAMGRRIGMCIMRGCLLLLQFQGAPAERLAAAQAGLQADERSQEAPEERGATMCPRRCLHRL